MVKKVRKILIYTDLDGTLLDHHSYSFQEALPALDQIRRRNIPLILCSSKTRSELEDYRKKLRINYPFISENGGAVFIPRGYFDRTKNLKVKGKYLVRELGIPYVMLRDRLLEVSRKFGIRVVGFGDLTSKQISREFGLTFKEARWAKRREYDEPFYFSKGTKPKELRAIKREFRRSGLKLTKGGRFYHLMGQSDKGKAVRFLARMYRQNWNADLLTIGVGDSLNDLPMLRAVDIPVLVRRKDSTHDAEILKRLKVRKAEGIGPSGWNKAILDLMGR